jgi:hypothetical protein
MDKGKGHSMAHGKKNEGESSKSSKILVMTHGRKHNPTQNPVQSKRIDPGRKSDPS